MAASYEERLTEDDRLKIQETKAITDKMTAANYGEDVSMPAQEKIAFISTVKIILDLIKMIGSYEISLSKLNEIAAQKPHDLTNQKFNILSETLEKLDKSFFVELAQEIEDKVNNLPEEVRNNSIILRRINSMREQLDLIE